MQKILISACLTGNPVRYDGQHRLATSEILKHWQQEGRLIAVCPELSGGLSVPRLPAEIQSGNGWTVLTGTTKVNDSEANDVSSEFIRGAQLALELAQRHSVRIAILKEGSPSCGSTQIYDGTFTGRKTAGFGVTAALLMQHGIRVFSELEIAQALALLRALEPHSQ